MGAGGVTCERLGRRGCWTLAGVIVGSLYSDGRDEDEEEPEVNGNEALRVGMVVYVEFLLGNKEEKEVKGPWK